MNELVEAQVRRTPLAPALVFNDECLSYSELNARANRLAHHLARRGIGPGVPVAVYLERSLELVVTLLGILKAGGAYLPLDSESPPERLRTLIAEAKVPLVVTQQRLGNRVSDAALLLLLDGDPDVLSDEPDTDVRGCGGSDRLAYVLFTSGSTGRPKGVAMSHRSVVNLLAWQCESFARPGPVRTLQFASVGFDVSFQEIFSTLASGGSLVLIDEELRRDLAALARFIVEDGIERIFVPALVLKELARHLSARSDRGDGLEAIAAGEQLEVTEAMRRIWERPGWSLENQYGPTETHVVTSHRLEGHPAHWPSLPSIGRPIPNTQVHVLDRAGDPVPSGVPGELYVGGVALAVGYLNRPDLTAERFLTDGRDAPASRLYRTGDLARWSADGTIEFLGRLDDQVKIRGHRVEPAEIAGALAGHAELRDAAVVPFHGRHGRRLAAYIVPEDDRAPSPTELRAFLAERLPSFMIPAAFAIVTELPLTANGKLDRRTLPEPHEDIGLEERYVAPRTRTEELLTGIWRDVLGVHRIGVDDNFFELGGDSLVAAEVIARTREELGRDIPLRFMFASPTVAGLAEAIDQGAAVSDRPIPRALRRTFSSLSGSDKPAQAGEI